VRDDTQTLLRSLADPQSGIWVGYMNSIPAGCIVFRPLPHLGSAGEIKRLYVKPAYRGRGIAALLLNELGLLATAASPGFISTQKTIFAMRLRSIRATATCLPRATTIIRKPQFLCGNRLSKFTPTGRVAIRGCEPASRRFSFCPDCK
jgi:GNAT superfamily N-acetyltransferase